MSHLARLVLVGIGAFSLSAGAQVIEFESGGLQYRTQTKNGVTVMVAPMPLVVREYSVIQVAVSNGALVSWTVKPEDFTFTRHDGAAFRGSAARKVVDSLVDKAGRNDVINLVSTYEQGLYGMNRLRSTNGYETRRQAALAEVSSTRLKAAAAASAIAFVQTKLAPGESTDGAVFFSTAGRPMGSGSLTVRTAGEVFEFRFTE